MSSNNSWNSRIPVQETLGGTGNAAYTTGDILFAAAANDLDRRTIGTAGQVLTVSGGVPVWAAAPAGTLTLLDSQTATAATSIEWDNTIITNTFSLYLIIWDSLDVSATDAFLSMRLSTDNGATFLTTSYSWGANGMLGDTGVLTDRSALGDGLGEGAIGLGNGQNSTGTRHTGGMALLFTPTEATVITSVAGVRNTQKGALNYGGSFFGGAHDTAAAHNAIRFLMDSGTFSGNFHIYGISV